MKLEKVTDSTLVNKMFRPTRLQSILHEFMEQDDLIMKLTFAPGKYKSPHTAQNSLRVCANNLRLPITVRVLNGEVYLIKTQGAKEIHS